MLQRPQQYRPADCFFFFFFIFLLLFLLASVPQTTQADLAHYHIHEYWNTTRVKYLWRSSFDLKINNGKLFDFGPLFWCYAIFYVFCFSLRFRWTKSWYAKWSTYIKYTMCTQCSDDHCLFDVKTFKNALVSSFSVTFRIRTRFD